ncbi:hypothetical protein HanIR_Chr04g0152431 [Helianthus annuus]|nr:hypothetical protein HanIR_Chr04g0152431 [Helianthus annuus]
MTSFPSLLSFRRPSLELYLVILFFICSNNKTLLRFKYCNSRSPLPFPIDLSPITHVKALPD